MLQYIYIYIYIYIYYCRVCLADLNTLPSEVRCDRVHKYSNNCGPQDDIIQKAAVWLAGGRLPARVGGLARGRASAGRTGGAAQRLP